MKYILPLIFIFSNYLLSSEVNVTGLKTKPQKEFYILGIVIFTITIVSIIMSEECLMKFMKIKFLQVIISL